jgi:L-asparaginase
MIAGSSSSNIATTGYTARAVGILTLVEAVPEIVNISNVAGIQVSNVNKENITSALFLSLSKQINDTIARAVVSHGTNVSEETAFFLDATVNCGKPVISVSAMRPSTAISADGPFNLLEAVTISASSLPGIVGL